MTDRRLTRDTKNAVLGGVAAGLANYFGVDPVLVRLVLIALAFLNGFGLAAYIVGWLIIPRADRVGASGGAGSGSGATPADRVVEKVREVGERVAAEVRGIPSGGGQGRIVAGAALIVLGLLFLLDTLSFWHWPQWARLANLWPLILIAVGVSIILEAARGRGARSS
jgi:phage shock protein C